MATTHCTSLLLICRVNVLSRGVFLELDLLILNMVGCL